MLRVQEVTKANGQQFYRIQRRKLFRWETIHDNIYGKQQALRALQHINEDRIKKRKTVK